jgi:CHAT domain-containing protein/tetratricopeptide (TPR) repeat protein
LTVRADLPAVAAAVLCFCWTAQAQGPQRVGITSLFVRSWTPELDPPVEALTPFEVSLVEVAAAARAGRFAAAQQQLTEMEKTSADPRDRFLVTLFRQQVALRRYRLPGGSQQYGGDTVEAYFDNVFLNGLTEVARAAAALPPLLVRDAFIAQQYSGVLPLLLFDRPYQYRRKLIEVAAPPEGVPSIESLLGQIGVMVDNVNREAVFQRALRQSDVDRLMQVARGLDLRAQDDGAAAAGQFRAALAGASPSAAAALMIDIGDAYAFPHGDALTFGIEMAFVETIRLAIVNAASPRALVVATPEQLHLAEEWYARAVAPPRQVSGETARAVAFRRAILELQQNRLDAALSAMHELASVDDAVGWTAGAVEGIFRRDKKLYGTAIASATREKALGITLALAALARFRAVAATASNDADSAAAVLEIAADVLEENGLRAASVTSLLQLASLYNAVGRYEAANVTARIALDRQLAFIRRIESLNRSNPPSAAMAPQARQQIDGERALLGVIAGEWSGALIMAALAQDRDPQAAFAEAERLWNEWQNGTVGTFSPDQQRTIRAAAESLAVMRGLTSASTRALRIDIPCEEVNEKLEPIREEAMRRGLSEWIAGLDVSNVRCGAARIHAAARELETTDLLAPFRTALAAVPAAQTSADLEKQFALQSAFRTLRGRLNTLAAGKAWDALERTARKMIELAASDVRVVGIHPYGQGYLALAQLGNEKAEDALATIFAFMSSPVWATAPIDVRLAVYQGIIEAEAQLCDCRAAACEPMAGLVAYENIYAMRRWMESVRSGVGAARRGSAELAALEARLAADEVFDDALLRRLHELRGVQDAQEFRLPLVEDADGVIDSLPGQVTALVYAPVAGGLAVFVLRRGTIDLRVAHVQPWDLERATIALQSELVDGLTGQWPLLARQLSRTLVEPVLPLPDGTTLVVVGSGLIARTPFDVLMDGSGRPLVEQHPIVYSDHVGFLRPAPLRAAGGGVLVAGVNGNGIQSAEQEARDVASLLHGTALVGRDATKEHVTSGMRGARRVHLAVHATLVPENPFESYFSFGNERLRAWELFRDAPDADLIALSACDTLAEARPALGMASYSGATTSFVSFAFSAGARYVLASLWRARDTVTADLMHRFYTALATDGLAESAAVQRAKLEIIAAGVKHPHYYANFVLSVRDVAALCPAEVP